ncbi:hypothetical protein RCL_jg4359.t1 [Rhizophagus clarus]|uniref:Uncharacterized protein n=1 Tax=Rhizophagus clarus TaxID=94130 RepID=A0A8H3KUB7_9GLOM|nr:hypothetical protein RCL_jg4359.t1 [Rhizophagus clarus]
MKNEARQVYIKALLYSFKTRVLLILEENFQSIIFQNVNDQGKQLIRTFSPEVEPIRYKPLAQQTNILNILISLIVHTALRVYSDFSDADIILPPPSLSTSNTKPNKSKKAASKSIEKVYINQIILNDKMNNVRDIFVYDISAALKHFNSGGKSQIVAYFEKYQDVKFCRKTTFNFNYNGTNYSLPWCVSPIFFQTKTKKPTKNSNNQNFGSLKVRSTNSKPTKD